MEEQQRWSFTRFIIGERLVGEKRAFFYVVLFSILAWPVFGLGMGWTILAEMSCSSLLGDICGQGVFLTILLYPLYILPVLRLGYWLSKRHGASYYYGLPFCPLVLLFAFAFLGFL